LGSILEDQGKSNLALEQYETLLRLNSANLDTLMMIIRVKGIKVPEDNAE